MGSKNGWHDHLVLGIWLSMTLTAGSTQGEHFSPPTNLTLKMNIFTLRWEWESSNNNNTVCKTYYYSYVNRPKENPKSYRSTATSRTESTLEINLNKWINFSVHSGCPNGIKQTEKTSMATLLVSGNAKTSVRNFNCVWYNSKYINCTWLPGEKAPPKVNYTLHYWVKSESSNMELKVPHSRLFEEFLDTAQTCSQYTYENGVPVGCHFEFTNETEELQFVVADVINKNIEPFYSWMKPFSKLQFPPPIIKISRNDKGEVYVSWNVSGQPSRKLPYQYQLYILNLNNEKALPTEPFTQENERSSKQIENIDPDAKYTVKLRTRYDTEYPWSEWSEEKNILGKPNYWTRNIILATVIPISVTIFTVIAVIYMKRFFLCIFPPIPHPGKIFEKSFSNQNNFQQFTQYNIVTENEEDVCSVILAESPLSSSSSSTCSSAVE